MIHVYRQWASGDICCTIDELTEILSHLIQQFGQHMQDGE